MLLPPAVERIERLLSHLYDVAPACEVGPYIVEPKVYAQLPGAAGGLDEQLLVHQHDDGLDLSLYLAPWVLRSLSDDDPWQRLHGGNLASLCLAVEGISHFLTVTWRYQQQRGISALEMELQAEVDKFVVAAWLCQAPDPLAQARARLLWRQLFAAPRLQPQLTPALVERYWLASRAAGRACAPMAFGDPCRLRPVALSQWARRFARLPLQAKLLS